MHVVCQGICPIHSFFVINVPTRRKIHTESGKKWLNRLQVEKVPVLVCLTYADKLYAEHMTEDGQHPDKRFMKQELTTQLSVSVMWMESQNIGIR